MKALKTHIVILFLLGCALNSSALQNDSIYCDTMPLSITFNCIPTLEGAPLNDGDLIILHYLTEAESFPSADTIIYSSQDSNSIDLFNTRSTDLATSMDVDFSVYSRTTGCLTNKVEYVVDSISPYSCEQSIISFNARNYTVAFSKTEICPTDTLIMPESNLPGPDFSITSFPEGLYTNENSTIVPSLSKAGDYTIIFESETYCLAGDTNHVTIFNPGNYEMGETIEICAGSTLPGYSSPDEDINFYPVDREEYEIPGTPMESGYYYIKYDSLPCPSSESVFVSIIQPPQLNFQVEQLCDRTLVEISQPQDLNEYSWEGGDETGARELFEDDYVFASAANMQGCVSYDSLFVEVKPLRLENVEFNKEEADCWEDGSLDIQQTTVNNYRSTFNLHLQNQLTGEIVSDLTKVPEGKYALQVVDDRECIADYPEPVVIKQKCLEEYPVFSPNGDNQEDRYFIPHEGDVKIYDRAGSQVIQLETPAYWDGKDETGRELPMGNYLIITDTGRPVNITIIR